MNTYGEARIANRAPRKPLMQFEFRIFGGDENGTVAAIPRIFFDQFFSDSAARSKAGRLAKRVKGPVDMAFAGAGKWDDRYITTASPSEHHASGYRFERLN